MAICTQESEYGAILEPMIEVEIRGDLGKEKYDQLKAFFNEHGEHVESHEREMIRIKGLADSDDAFVDRNIDVRLRKTNGECEIMLKRKASTGNVGREEISVPLEGDDMQPAREFLKALGYTRGMWMSRQKEVYRYHDVEWSLVKAPQDIYYYEAEQDVPHQNDIDSAQEYLNAAAAALDLEVFTQDETQQFINMLNETVNKEVEL